MIKPPSSSIESFVEEIVGQKPPPPFWTLRLVEDLGKLWEVDQGSLDHGLIVRRRPDSQTLEIDFPGPEDMAVKPVSVEEELRRMALAEDERDLAFVESESAGVVLEMGSAVMQSDRLSYGVDVVGPGGKAVAYHTARGVSADVTIRRRVNPEPGYWRNYKDILARLRCDCPDSTGDLCRYAAFGYFELSKYEPQSLMRPVFLFSCEQPQDTEGQWPGWQVTIVEPATASKEFALQDGLGCWNE